MYGFTDRSSSVGYSCHQVHFRIDRHAVNRGSERPMFRQVLTHPSECLMIRLPPHWISFPIQPNSNTSISVGYAVDEVDIRQLGVHITIHVHHMLSMSEMRKPRGLILQADIQCHLSLSAHAFQCNYSSSQYSLPTLQVCTRHSGTTCIVYLSFTINAHVINKKNDGENPFVLLLKA
ncbi:hypothetical protein TNCV_1673611 [Trichonephila clavipes]|nr:hypothetical protein TNCV_1673611 [Trichonephila clavipes]